MQPGEDDDSKILSLDVIAKMQMIEAIPVPSANSATKPVDVDYGVGWFASPVNSSDTDEQNSLE